MERKQMYRSNDSVIFGVCGGIAEYFDLSPWGVRLVWVLLVIIGLPFTIVAYIALALLLKRKPLPQMPPYEEWRERAYTNSDRLRQVAERFEKLDRRLQRMESIVTSPQFRIERECNEL